MPLVGAVNPIDLEIRAQVDQAVKETERFIAEMDKAKAEFKAAQADMDRQNQASEQAAKSNTMSWTDFRSMYQTVLDVVRVGVAVWDETGQKFVDNAIKVGDLARLMGTTTEEASRLKEVSDDVGISFESVARAMKLAEKDGFQPGIASLQKMSEEYLALAPGVDRAQYLIDRFGRSGDEMGKLLEKGSESIGKMSAAIDENLLVTQKGYEEARKYQISMDALKDSWDAFTYKAAPPLIKAVTNAIDMQRDLGAAQDAAAEAGKNWWLMTLDQRQAYIDNAKAARENADAALLTADAADTAGDAFESEKEKTKAATEAIKEMTKANQDEIALISSMQSLYQGYIDKQKDLEATHSELLAKKKELIAQGYSPEGQTILDINKKLEENSAAQQENAAAVDMAVKTKILAMLQEQAAADGLSQAETAKLLDLGLKWGVYSQEAVDMAKRAQEEMAKLAGGINDLPEEKNISINLTVMGAEALQALVSHPVSTTQKKFASGGSFIVPSEYGSEGFALGNMGTASAGELVTVTPRGGSTGAGGGGVVVNILLDSATPDPERVAYQLAPAVTRVLRNLGVATNA